MHPKVLFVCIHNSGRSQMAEAWLNELSPGDIVAMSAGFEPRGLNPVAVRAMAEVGVDLSAKQSDSVFDFFKRGLRFNYIITVCDEGNAQKCPIFPGVSHRIHWSFKDPSEVEGTDEEKMAQVRQIRDAIRAHVEDFLVLFSKGEIARNAPSEWKFQK